VGVLGVIANIGNWLSSDRGTLDSLLVMGIVASAGLLWHIGALIVGRIRVARMVAAATATDRWPPT
jgi:hypothetical protein